MEKKLIEFMRNNPIFYDRQHTSYRNQLLKDEKWLEFSIKTGVPVDALKKRWKSLRDRYYRILKTGDSRKSNYKYFEELQFLSGVELFKRRTFEINDDEMDNILTKSEDSLLLDQASYSSFDDTVFTAANSPTGKNSKLNTIKEKTPKELRENIELRAENLQSTTPFRAFLESIALAVEESNFDLSDVMRLQMSILQLVQTEVENHMINAI